MFCLRDANEAGSRRSSRGLVRAGIAFLFCLLMAGVPARGDDIVETLLDKAQYAQLMGDTNTAMAIANKAVELDSTNAQCYYVRGRLHSASHAPDKAVQDFTRALEIEPRGAEIYQLRGLERFKLGQYNEAISDFDRFLKFVPKQEAYHWHRGIAYYFAGRYEDGRKQFQLRQSAGTNTIENALWHFICSARVSGIEKARTSMLIYQEDGGLIMRKVYDLFAGKSKPEEVLATAQANYTSTAQLNRQMFSANFYLGFYYDLKGEAKLALEHAKEAAGQYKLDQFMGEVAVQHWKVLEGKR